jgi:hypothetical protein
MAASQYQLIAQQAQQLSPQEQLRLIQELAEQFSTEEDFKLAEWHPTEEELNGN